MAEKSYRTDNSFENSIEITEVLLAHKCTYRRGEVCRVYQAGRNFSGYVCPISGSAIYRLSDGGTFTLEVGEILYLPAMSKYTVEGGEKGFTHYTVNFLVSGPMQERKSAFSALFGQEPMKVSAENFDEFKSIFSKAVAALGTNIFGSVLLVKAHIYEIMHMFFAQAARTRASGGEYEALLAAREFIEAHYCENIRARDLSLLCSMSETSLRRKFREYLGQPPLDYQISLRIRRAKELLLERRYNVSEVAALVGFDDVNYFSRLFKKRVGVSPMCFEKMY